MMSLIPTPPIQAASADHISLALDEVLAPNPRNRLHDQHPQPPASFQSRQRNRPIDRGSILDADPPIANFE